MTLFASDVLYYVTCIMCLLFLFLSETRMWIGSLAFFKPLLRAFGGKARGEQRLSQTEQTIASFWHG